MVNFRRIMLLTPMAVAAVSAHAFSVKGVVLDQVTKEPLIGATIQVEGTSTGAITDIDGRFEINHLKGQECNLIIQYVSYKTQKINIRKNQKEELVIALAPDNQQLDEVTVVAKKNLENERALMMERQKSSVAIENLGAKEMSAKGISNVEEGVKKITGVSIASAGQIIVRGLGDRYSTTTLNGLPIASPNPDNKLIPLDLFPTSTVKNITVSKVYQANSFADYSGAHIDIGTKEQTGEDFFNLSFNVGGKFNTLGKDMYQMDRDGSLFKTPSLNKHIQNMDLADFEDYATQNKLFNTDFDVKKKNALPEFGGNIGVGKNFDIKGNTLSVLASFGISNSQQAMENAYVRTLEASGNTLNDFDYDRYSNELKIAGLGSVGYTFRGQDQLSYTFFYARNAVDTYMRREGFDYEDHNLIGSNNVTHIYSLQNHQLSGKHHIGKQWTINWGGSYSKTGSDEPDRRQVMFEKKDGQLELFKLNRQETMRYFGTLDEKEWVGNLSGEYKFGENHRIQAGFTYKDKSRDYMATRFYYNLNKLDPTINDIYTPSDFINQGSISDGQVVIDRKKQPKDSYDAGNRIYAGYILADIYPIEPLLINVGLRYEVSKQWVNYYDDQSKAKRRDLNTNDLFPALNMKYQLNKANSLRFSFSRTVTRPSFIEMAPFLYQESYGAAQIRGNADLQNGYNYNIDLRYELFNDNGDMLSITGYYKFLEAPIERVQTLVGGAAEHSFRNADNGMAAGVEVEFRKELVKDLRIGANASYMYTNVKLPEGGAYTNDQRALQGASPYLVNADITYSPRFGEEQQLSTALLYNLQGPRIHAVGIAGLGDIEQQPVQTLNFVGSYRFNSKFSVKLQVNDLLNRSVIFKQEVPQTGKELEVERFKRGTSFEIGVTYNL
ncbi:TonB-dependent receptor [uncultured Bacteroides sp.]|uniref:TonB-dependent receptor n=1 Tax=uncultured Bacteroides sp. TaxID=162156 RepID=UPI00262090DF|nr:TonB-dependent receptor [uncultured Bacteroides sp.]